MDGKYRICVVRDDGSLRDCGEGPFDSFNEAKEFQRNEVGAKSVITGPIYLKYFVMQGFTPSRGISSVKLSKLCTPCDGLYDLLEIDEDLTTGFEEDVRQRVSTILKVVNEDLTHVKFNVPHSFCKGCVTVYWWIELEST